MGETHSEAGDRPAGRLFDAVERRLPFAATLSVRINSLPDEPLEWVYWFIALLGMLPALRADLLFPHTWFDRIQSDYSFSWIENPLGFFSLAFALAIFFYALAKRAPRRLLAAAPFVALFAASEAGTSLTGLNSVYVFSAAVVFAYFILEGRFLSPYFAAFAVFLCVWQYQDTLLAWHQIVVFVAVSLVCSLLHEGYVQNRPLLQQLGKKDVASLLRRTFSLWSPTLVLLAIGLSIGSWISGSTAEMLYAQTFVDPYCEFSASPDDAVLPCPASGQLLTAEDLRPLSDDENVQASLQSVRKVVEHALAAYFAQLGESSWKTLDAARETTTPLIAIVEGSDLWRAMDDSFAEKAHGYLQDAGPQILAHYRADVIDIANIQRGAERILATVTQVAFDMAFESMQRYRHNWQQGYADGAISRFCELKDAGLAPFRCPEDLTADSRWRLKQLSFHHNLDLSVDREFEEKERALDQQLQDIGNKALEQPGSVRDGAKKAFAVVPRDLGIHVPRCEWHDLKCHLVGMVKRGVRKAYGNTRQRMQDSFVTSMHGKATAGAIAANQGTTVARAGLAEAMASWRWQTRATLARAYKAGNLLDIFLTLWLVLVAIKSFLYVFARVIFDRHTDIYLDVLEDAAPATEGKVTHVEEIAIPGGYPHDIYYKSNYQPLGPAPRFCIPQWRSSLFSRLRFGAYNMNRVDMPLDDAHGVTFNATEAHHLVDWEMQEGEEVIFSYRNFVAMNENIQLRTVISLRVATLLMGRYVFHTAKCIGGPGRLILRTRGKPATAEQVQQSIPISRLVAWNRYARFSVDSHLTRRDIFLNGFNLRRSHTETDDERQGNLIVEADAREGGILVGSLRFARHFVLPI